VGAKQDGTITSVKRKGFTGQHDDAIWFCRHFIENTKIPNIYGRAEFVKVNKGPTRNTLRASHELP